MRRLHHTRSATTLFSIAASLGLLAMPAAASEHVVVDFGEHNSLRWQVVNDGVMGGLSRGSVKVTEGHTLLFAGETSLRNNGGFSSIRT